MRSRLCSRRIILATVLGVLALAGGCSRIERVKVVSHFGQPVNVRLLRVGNGFIDVTLPAHGATVLKGKYYIGGGGVRVVVRSIQGRILKQGIVNVPGDSAFRRIALVEVSP